MNLFSLEGKIAIVTGSARGNGKAMRQALTDAGAVAIGVDTAIGVDVTNTRQMQDFIDGVLASHNRLDILVNNAGITCGHDALTYPDDLWDRTYRVNLKAVFDLCKIAAKAIGKNGSIINITSINAELGFPDNPAYVAMKGAVKQLTKALALDFGKNNIRVNNIGPGYIVTDMTKKSYNDPEKNLRIRDRTILGRWGKPEDLAGAVVFLASDASSYITGQDIYVDGGWLARGL